MSGLEQAIRNALDRAERSNPETRSRIYQSARNALDAGLRKQDIDDPMVIERQRQRLELTIRTIEDEELEKLRMAARLEKIFIENRPFAEPEPDGPEEEEAEPEAPHEPVVEARRRPEPEFRSEPVLEPEGPTAAREPRPEPAEDGSLSDLSVTREVPLTAKTRVEPMTPQGRGKRREPPALREEEDAAWAEPSTPEGRRVSPKKRSRRRKRGSWIISLFVYCVLLGAIGFAGWWVYATGMVAAALHGGGDFDFIPKELQTEDFDPGRPVKTPLDPLRSFSGDWIGILTPGNGQSVAPAAQAKVSDVADSDGKAIMIASDAPDQDGEVRIPVSAEILDQLAGKTSTLAVTLRADGEQPSQIYVQCEFASLGDCGRHRFTVSNERTDELIQVRFEGKPASGQPGYVIINSDLTGEGRAIRLYGIRVLPGS